VEPVGLDALIEAFNKCNEVGVTADTLIQGRLWKLVGGGVGSVGGLVLMAS
jgi:hypothetical protein